MARFVFRASDMRSGQRRCWAVAFALLLAMRLLTPTGFMPAWTGNGLEISLCEDAGPPLGAAAHHGHHGKQDKAERHQPCPYAASTAQTLLNPPAAIVAEPPAPDSVAASVGRPSGNRAWRKYERPPSRAPPLLA